MERKVGFQRLDSTGAKTPIRTEAAPASAHQALDLIPKLVPDSSEHS
jgi:hypothetical protein